MNLLVSCFITSLVYKRKLHKKWNCVASYHISDHLYNIFLENDGSENCAQLLKEVNEMFGTKYLNDEHDCNIVSMNSLNIHDANDMQSHKLGDAMFDDYDIFVPQVLMRKIITISKGMINI